MIDIRKRGDAARGKDLPPGESAVRGLPCDRGSRWSHRSQHGLHRWPPDYDQSLLEPAKIEGYTNLVTLKNGDAHAGGIVSESKTSLLSGSYGHASCCQNRSQPNDFSGFPVPVADRTVNAGRIRRPCRSCLNSARKI